jgi:hypothetical protein
MDTGSEPTGSLLDFPMAKSRGYLNWTKIGTGSDHTGSTIFDFTMT